MLQLVVSTTPDIGCVYWTLLQQGMKSTTISTQTAISHGFSRENIYFARL